MIKKFNKTELVERYTKVIDKANEFLDKDDVQKVKKMADDAKGNKSKNQAWVSETMKLQKKYCKFEDSLSSTALMMAITGNPLF